MRDPSRTPIDRLWRGLADAQDAAIDGARPPAVLPAQRAAGRRRRGPSRALGVAFLGLGAAAAVAAGLYLRPSHLRGGGRAGQPGEAERVLVADARSDLQLQFTDGSNLTFRAGSTGRMQRLGGDGADVVLERGRLEAHVVHAQATLWLVHAGPYRVRVTGTRFAVDWSAGRLDVALFEGAVLIDGGVLGAGVPLQGGHRLTVDRGTVRTDLLSRVEAPAAAVAPSEAPPPPALAVDPSAPLAATPPRGRGDERGDWLALARQGAYAAAFSAAERVGWTRLCQRLDARQLLMLGDVARYTDAGGRAEEAFETLVTRFPHHQLAADAVFSLGRLAFESHQPDRAAG